MYFQIEIFCSSCLASIDKVFKKYHNVAYTVDSINGILKVVDNQNELNDQQLIKELKSIGIKIEKFE
ncbi:hypothetical protein [[Mycoplasma] cavipharyngis]|uniref:hypothetical protein n=1 Tax=[Mycoplasma] cavipharyngis TaxID=92757 RepID=UPI003703C26D